MSLIDKIEAAQLKADRPQLRPGQTVEVLVRVVEGDKERQQKFRGEVINVRDVITFEGTTVEEVQTAFRESVDDYLDFCAQRGESPEKPFSGKFVIRLPAELHRKVYVQAKLEDKSLNNWVKEVLQSAVQK